MYKKEEKEQSTCFYLLAPINFLLLICASFYWFSFFFLFLFVYHKNSVNSLMLLLLLRLFRILKVSWWAAPQVTLEDSSSGDRESHFVTARPSLMRHFCLQMTAECQETEKCCGPPWHSFAVRKSILTFTETAFKHAYRHINQQLPDWGECGGRDSLRAAWVTAG